MDQYQATLANWFSILTNLFWHFFIVHKAIYVSLKILSKYIQVWSCFESLIERDIVVQSEFEFDV